MYGAWGRLRGVERRPKSTNIDHQRLPIRPVQRHPDGDDQEGDGRVAPQDRDFAYLGRLPRPDGKGSLIVFTGIHPPGSLGAVHLLSSRLAELYAEVGTENFSTIVGTQFHHDTHEPIAVELTTPLHRFEET